MSSSTWNIRYNSEKWWCQPLVTQQHQSHTLSSNGVLQETINSGKICLWCNKQIFLETLLVINKTDQTDENWLVNDAAGLWCGDSSREVRDCMEVAFIQHFLCKLISSSVSGDSQSFTKVLIALHQARMHSLSRTKEMTMTAPKVRVLVIWTLYGFYG